LQPENLLYEDIKEDSRLKLGKHHLFTCCNSVCSTVPFFSRAEKGRKGGTGGDGEQEMERRICMASIRIRAYPFRHRDPSVIS